MAGLRAGETETVSAVLVVRGQEQPVAHGQTLAEALRSLGLNPEAYLAVRNGEMIPMAETVREGDTIRLVAVISGGNVYRRNSDNFDLDI